MGQKTENRGQKSEVRGQEGKGPKTKGEEKVNLSDLSDLCGEPKRLAAFSGGSQ
jgi:hypothetical protein